MEYHKNLSIDITVRGKNCSFFILFLSDKLISLYRKVNIYFGLFKEVLILYGSAEKMPVKNFSDFVLNYIIKLIASGSK